MTPPRRSRPTPAPRRRHVAGTRKRPDPAPARPEPVAEEPVAEETEVVAPPVIDSAPRPRAKHAEPEPEPTAEPDASPDPEPESEAEAESEAPAEERPWWQLPALLTAVAVVFAALAVWFAAQAATERAESGVDNRALVDTGVTTEVAGQITTAVQSVFSLDYADMGKAERVAKDVLTGKAVEQYDTLFAEVRKLAPEQKIVLTTTTRQVGVKSIEGDRALVLVFADQHVERTADGRREDVPVQVTLTTERADGRWRISDIVLR
ncbi:hypothetical protein [Allokutzneria albata]|uniref:Mce-associated membrane protein n=1 Tax=Allokutzneria albata TaxID=211114 RepID=A0A1G9YZU8_ALLAB|nr:hypothetical protein [Allokutzneria albata]SDN14550.1 Mce-associated membrane protein [Allokutzneria albata]